MREFASLSRRGLLGSLAAVGATAALGAPAWAAQPEMLSKPIPRSGEELAVIGLGSWITFNVGNDPVARAGCAWLKPLRPRLPAFLQSAHAAPGARSCHQSADALLCLWPTRLLNTPPISGRSSRGQVARPETRSPSCSPRPRRG